MVERKRKIAIQVETEKVEKQRSETEKGRETVGEWDIRGEESDSKTVQLLRCVEIYFL